LRLRDARPWAFFAWTVQGIGILVGAYWAYEELGWGGYWNWDPVENGSLIPWLTATALIHAAMVYRQRGALKRTTVVLAVATFAACNFAAFLTRSGIFSSLHAFSQSPIGWMFLLLIAALSVGTAVFLVRRRVAMMPDNPVSGLLAKEGVATASVFALILLAMAVVGLAVMTAIAVAASWVLDARQHDSTTPLRSFLLALRNRRRTYASYVIHLGLACLAVGVAGSSLGTQQHEATLSKGESIGWAGRNVRFIGVLQHRLREKLVVQAELEVTADGEAPYTLRPAQEFYFSQNEWSTEVAIHSTWSGDFYTILHSGQGQDRIQLTLVENPMMRWMWLAGWITVAGAAPWFWPSGKRADSASPESHIATNRQRPTRARQVGDKPRRTAA